MAWVPRICKTERHKGPAESREATGVRPVFPKGRTPAPGDELLAESRLFTVAAPEGEWSDVLSWKI